MSACGTCGSQDTTFASGISKKTGKPWTAYDCNEKQCVQANGRPNRTFAFSPKSPVGKVATLTPGKFPTSTLEKKVDQILAILVKNFGNVTVQKEEVEETSPF